MKKKVAYSSLSVENKRK